MDHEATADAVVDAWGSAPTPPRPSTATSNKPVVNYDDGGEPDFEGWLNAQAAAKSKGKGALPKGLVKKTPVVTASRPSASTRVSSAAVGTSKAVAAKKTSVKKEEEPEEEDWGDAWG